MAGHAGTEWRSSAPGRPARSPRSACSAPRGDVEIDLFERLPTPWGLLRDGVAPDHQEIKRLDETFDRETLGRGCRFFGNVEVGVDVSQPRRADAPLHGRDLRDRRADRQVARDPGRGPARELAGHRVRGLVQRPPGLPRPRVRPLVAARGRDRERQRGCRRDPHADAQPGGARAHRRRRPRTRGAAREPGSRRWSCSAGAAPRRPPSRAPSCASSGRLDGVDAARRSGGDRARPAVEPLARRARHLHRAEERGAAARVRGAPAARGRAQDDRPPLPPLAGRDSRRRQSGGDRRRPQRDRRGRRRVASAARRWTKRSRRSSAGSSCAPSATAPSRCRACRSTSAATSSRTTGPGAGDRTANALPGVYAVGWIKRGPTGILGTNKRDAEETVPASPRTSPSGALPAARIRRARTRSMRCSPSAGPASSPPRAGGRSIPPSSAGASEEQRPRVKLASREELLAAAITGH